MGDGEEPRCHLSHPLQPHSLCYRTGRNLKQNCSVCGSRKTLRLSYDDYSYYCNICDLEFHNDCLLFPSKITHPFHLQHPLTFSHLNYETEIISDTNSTEYYSFLTRSGFDTDIFSSSESNIIFSLCTWCDKDLGDWFYRCSICNFFLDLDCVLNIPSLTIKNPKSHHHSLALFPRPLSVPCDACGLVSSLEPSYICFQCNYFVHKSCIDLPRVIKITRHPHCLSHTPYLPSKVSSCQVCYKGVDMKYGHYACNNEDCFYVIHSKCATNEKVWDGRELEWEPEEEPNEDEDIEPFKKIDTDVIDYFCHEHHLKLEKYDAVRDSWKQCEACILQINTHDFYNCMECEFFLHEKCANLPRKLDSALHNHTLFLDVIPQGGWDSLNCSACYRKSNGFMYKCTEITCMMRNPFRIDVRCILLPECFTHKSHQEHPLFFSTFDNYESTCSGCRRGSSKYHLQCTVCEFSLCYECATIPNEIYYRFDEHLLSLCYGEDHNVVGIYWCEVCEKRLNPTEWFYTCQECCITVHLKCLFGDCVFMKSDYVLDYKYEETLMTARNGATSRPICRVCHHRCQGFLYFQLQRKHATNSMDICSFNCLMLAPLR